jgi:hypothetical protein
MDQKSGKPSQKRRAILQGSLAAPVVLTVSSPSAAMVSSHMKCIANVAQPADAALPGIFFVTQQVKDSPSDTWFRTSVTVEQFSHGGQVAWFYKQANNVYVNINTLTPMPNGWQKVDLEPVQTRWALVWVDTSGNQYGVIQVQRPTSSYVLTTESCNASVNPAIR